MKSWEKDFFIVFFQKILEIVWCVLKVALSLPRFSGVDLQGLPLFFRGNLFLPSSRACSLKVFPYRQSSTRAYSLFFFFEQCLWVNDTNRQYF
jgi:hypothetical protein